MPECGCCQYNLQRGGKKDVCCLVLWLECTAGLRDGTGALVWGGAASASVTSNSNKRLLADKSFDINLNCDSTDSVVKRLLRKKKITHRTPPHAHCLINEDHLQCRSSASVDAVIHKPRGR